MAYKEPVPGWTQPVYKGMKEGALLWGVPFLFGAMLLMTALVFLLWYWPVVPVIGGLFGIAAIGTAIEPRWKDILKRHLFHRHHYEG